MENIALKQELSQEAINFEVTELAVATDGAYAVWRCWEPSKCSEAGSCVNNDACRTE